MRVLDPSIDVVFKLLFDEPSDERRLIAMLTAILEPSSPIVSAKVLNPGLPPDVLTAKSIVLDVLVQLGDGRRVDIEMETWPKPVFIARDLYYWARAHSKQLGSGGDYDQLPPTISIAWLADPGDERRGIVDSRRVHTRYRICDLETKAELTDQLEMHLLDLRNLSTDATLSPSLRRWAEFFDHPTEATLRRLEEEDTIMADTIHKLRSVSADDAAYYLAEARFKGEVKQRLERAYEREEGRKEGREEGRKEGREEGREEGRTEGRARTLVRQLELKFGPLSPTTRARVDSASPEELEAFLERILFAQEIADVFSP